MAVSVATAIADSLARMKSHVRASCTNTPGVYRMIAANGEVVYVGKSRRLRTRLLGYFRAEWPADKGARIIREASTIEWDYTTSEFAALLLELHCIKRFRPRMNVAMMRDARHYAFVKLTRAPAPRLMVVRSAGSEDGGSYFGPYQGARRVTEAVRELNDVLGLRDCASHVRMYFADQRELFVLPPRTPACIRHEIGKCLGPCVAACTAGDYQGRVRLARHFLEFGDEHPLQLLRAEMQEASDRMEFERAAALRDKAHRLQALRDSLERLRFAVEDLTFVYTVPGVDGDNRLYLIRRGRVRAELAEPRSRQERAQLQELCRGVFGGTATESPTRVPAHEIDQLLLLSSWFQRFPDELARTTPPDSWL